jgi:hypothetical protein
MPRMYKLTPPQYGAKPFMVRVETDPRIVVYSNKTGQWQVDPNIQIEDLMMPEQGPLYDWDVERVNNDSAPNR